MKTFTFFILGIIVSLFPSYGFSSDQILGVKTVPTEQSKTMSYALKSIKHRNIRGGNIDLRAWHPQGLERCYLQDRENNQNENVETIKKLFVFINKEPAFAKYFSNLLLELNPALCVDDRADETRGYYDSKYNVIAVREHLNLLEKHIIFVHEIRHIDHILKGFHYSLDYAMEEIVRMTFAIEADVQAIVTLFARRVKEQKCSDVWHTLSEFEKYADISEVFKEEMLASQNELKATRAAFSQWYKSEWRVDAYFKNTYSIYFDLLDETKKIQNYWKLPENYFDKLCILPSGKNYDCHLTDEIQENH